MRVNHVIIKISVIFCGLLPMVSASAPMMADTRPKLLSINTDLLKKKRLTKEIDAPLVFDYPITYNDAVKRWISYFQTTGRNSFKIWMERASRFGPVLQYELAKRGLPQDLMYVAMVESGFSAHAESHKGAMGMWQFIEPTAKRYNLKVTWWLDERKDVVKSTRAAINYMSDLFNEFKSWYLVAASYNMGENGVRRIIQKNKTRNFWELADRNLLPDETKNYVPKIIAAMLISKAPALYGFRSLDYQMPYESEYFHAPAGTDVMSLATFLGVSDKYMRTLNPELIHGFIPRNVGHHLIRIPKGSMLTVSQFMKAQLDESGSKN